MLQISRPKRKFFIILFTFLFSSLSFLLQSQESWTDDGNLLKRSPEETCHGCHKTDRNAPADPNSIKTHNSSITGSTKWGPSGGWGIAGGKYGEFGCTTCHTAHATRNVFLIKETISAPDGSNWESTGTATVNPVVLKKNSLAGSPNPGVSDGVLGDDTGGHTSSSRVCQACHTMTNHHRYNTSGQTGLDHYDGQDCTQCHSHENGFVHGGGGGGCQSCHGHEDDWPVVPGNTWHGTKQSHATHTENDSDDLRGPNLTCADCHDTTRFPRFKDGQDLAGTTVCDNCHSPGGAFDGVNSASGSVGAKDNWKTGVYTGNALQAGKEKWCIGCHDTGTAVIGGRQAPNVAGNNTTYGYYVSGHGSRSTECGGCHSLGSKHIDGKKTFLAASNNYTAGFRLNQNMTVPVPASCNYNSNNFALCLSCHSEQNLLSDTKSRGCYDCVQNPYKNAAAIITNFRNTHPNGFNTGFTDIPANFHADHLIDAQSFGLHWYSDGPGSGTGLSGVSCTTCHNPHGDVLSTNNATPKMTRGYYEVIHSSDATGDYGQVTGTGWDTSGNPKSTCNTNCHWNGAGKWYYNAVPYISSMAVSDMNTSDPSPADMNYTNNRNVTVTLLAIGGVHMMMAEDAAFTTNSTGWISYASSYTYTLSATEGAKKVYVKLRNARGESNTTNYSMTLDMTSPTVPATAIISPNGGEAWIQGSIHAITWSGVSDTNLKVSPITLKYSTDGGVTYPNTIATNLANSGTYTWTLPMINSATVRVQLIATDRAGNQASDVSNANFTISP